MMKADVTFEVMVLARLGVLLLETVLTVVPVSAYRRARTRYLRKAAIGFGIVTVGVFLEGVLYHAAGFDLVAVHTIESIVVGIGFHVILSSLR